MSCDRWTDAVSAMADGEDPGIDPRLVDAHLARCASCRSFRADVEAMRRPLRVGPAPAVPDLSRRVVKRNAIADRASAWGAVRILLAVVAIQIVALSIPALVLGSQANASTHEARHLGAFGVAYAVALFVVVVRPARARSILPVAAMLAGALLITAIIDIAEGRVPLTGETMHLPEVLSVVFVWLLATPAGRRGVRGRRASSPQPSPALRLLDDTLAHTERADAVGAEGDTGGG
jgi:predicted anti-sigma-YlaC factor YlaD